MPTDIRVVALAAVAEVADEHPGEVGILYATRIVRNKLGCELREAIDAVKWARERPPAASLPAGSIVATAVDAYVKSQGRERSAEQWSVTGVGDWHYSDNDIDAMVRASEATILRVGTGA
jgi:hypothetical protein